MQSKILNTIDFFSSICYTILYKTKRCEESMTTLNFALDAQKYTKCRALLWGNCAGHFQKAFGAEAMSGGRRFVHFLIAVIELVPVIGQVASLFERAIVKGVLEKKPPQPPQPSHNFNTITKFDDIEVKTEETKTEETKTEEGEKSEEEKKKEEEIKKEEEKKKEEIKQWESDQFACPIAFEDLRCKNMDPVILEGDCNTYNRESIQGWLSKHLKSPVNNKELDERTSRVYSNYIVRMKNPVCPITKNKFKEPYFCKENGQTYEREAIENWFNNQSDIKELNLIPNRVMFPKDVKNVPGEALVLKKEVN